MTGAQRVRRMHRAVHLEMDGHDLDSKKEKKEHPDLRSKHTRTGRKLTTGQQRRRPTQLAPAAAGQGRYGRV